MFEAFPTQKLLIFFGLSAISWLTDGFFVLSSPIAMVGKHLLLIILCWCLAGQLTQRLLNKQNVVGQLNKRAVLITGCDRGFGHLTALQLNELGMTVFAGCLNANSEDAAKLKKVCRFPDRMHLIQLNVTNDNEISSAIEQIEQVVFDKRLTLHALINNAGVGRACPVEFGSFDFAFESTLNVNLIAPIKLTRAVLPLMRKSKQNQSNLIGDARIINICSQASVFHVSPIAAYCVTKTGLLAFTNCLRQEIDMFNMQAVSIEPSFFATDIISQQSIHSNLHSVLDSTSSDVLEAYGPTFTKEKLQNVQANIVSKKIHLVIDTIVEATQACQPEMRYTVAEPLDKLFLFAASLLPVEVVFCAYKCFYKLIHLAMVWFPSAKFENKINEYFRKQM